MVCHSKELGHFWFSVVKNSGHDPRWTYFEIEKGDPTMVIKGVFLSHFRECIEISGEAVALDKYRF